MDLLALTDFNLVAQHGGFGKAARASGRPNATLSRRVMALEESLGLRLLERGSRAFRLTEDGQALRARTEHLLAEIAEIGKGLGGAQGRPRGPLRVSSPLLFAHVAMGRIAAEFVRRCPEVQLEVTAEDRFVDLVEEGYDLVIRTNPQPDSALVGRCFLQDRMLLVAAAGVPRPTGSAGTAAPVPAVLLAARREVGEWRVQGDDGTEHRFQPEPRLRLSSMLMVRDAVRTGAGAALLPESIAAEDLASGRLVRWGALPGKPVEVWVLHTSRRLVSAKVTAFVQCLCESFPGGTLG